VKPIILRLVFLVLALSLSHAPAAVAQETQQQEKTGAAEESKAPERPGKILVPSGTQLLLVLHNTLTSRNAKPGHAVYLETIFPIFINEKVVIPSGSYVMGEVVEAKRPGRVKGRAELMITLKTITLPNGYTASFAAVPENMGTGGNETVEEEGKVKGDTDKSSDAGTVLRTTATGAGIGAAAGAAGGNIGRGAGIGLAGGAAVGLMAVLLSRGPEVELPRGTTVDAVLSRPLYLDAEKITFTDPGKPSVLPGPSGRQPTRNRFPN